jgi:hypothetical protein
MHQHSSTKEKYSQSLHQHFKIIIIYPWSSIRLQWIYLLSTPHKSYNHIDLNPNLQIIHSTSFIGHPYMIDSTLPRVDLVIGVMTMTTFLELKTSSISMHKTNEMKNKKTKQIIQNLNRQKYLQNVIKRMKVENTIILWKKDQKKWFVVNTRIYFGYSTLKYATLMKIIKLWVVLEFNYKILKTLY